MARDHHERAGNIAVFGQEAVSYTHLRRVGERKLDAAETLGDSVVGSVHVVHRVITVEVRDVLHEIGVVLAVRVRPPHDLAAKARVDREGAIGCR